MFVLAKSVSKVAQGGKDGDILRVYSLQDLVICDSKDKEMCD